MKRRGFTLVELLVAITIITLLSGLVFGALMRASAAAKIVNTKSTIARLNASLMDRWDGYRTRRLPIDPQLLFISGTTQGANARAFAAQLWAQRGSQANDPLNVQPGNPQGLPYPSNLQVAATRLACMREMMQFEMPNSYRDFIGNFVSATTPGSYTLRAPNYLPTQPQLVQSYLRAVNAAGNNGATFAQIEANQSAECLYMILTLGSTDSGMFGEQLPSDDIGDVDGDGLPEFQDAWPVALSSYQPKGKANSPIDFIRWPAGFVSDLQPDPFDPRFVSIREFCLSHHEYFDPLKLDLPPTGGSTPRGFQLIPLIYSAGPDGGWCLVGNSYSSDPYDASGPGMSGALDASAAGSPSDNVTNHDLDTRSGK